MNLYYLVQNILFQRLVLSELWCFYSDQFDSHGIKSAANMTNELSL